LVVTFTRAAAAELVEKLGKDPVISGGKLPLAMTLHSFSMRILMSDAYRARIPLPLRVLDDWEQDHMLYPTLARLCNFTNKDRNKIAAGKIEIYEAGWQSLDADHEDWSKSLDPLFHKSLESLRTVFGFTLIGELPYKLREYLKSDLGVVSRLRLSYILVDEFQDLNPCDQDIIRLLTAEGAHLSVFGDDDQSIYSFRQAAPRGILHFKDHYPSAEKIILEVCYRCPQPIVSLAREVIEGTTMVREEKNVRANKNGPCEIKCLAFDEGGEEVSGVLKIAQWFHERATIDWKDILILVPTKKFGNYLAKALEREAIPVDNWLKERDILQSPEMRRLFSILRIYLDHQDALALWTYFSLSRGFGDAVLLSLVDMAVEHNCSFSDMIEQVRDGSFSVEAGIRRKVTRILEALEGDVAQVTDWFTDYERLIGSLVERASPENKEWIESSLRALFNRTDDEGLSPTTVVQRMQTAKLSPAIEPEIDKVRLMTMHKAKGLSAKCVFIPFLEDENLIVEGLSAAQIEEKRRLLYVSLTRSKHYLILSYSLTRQDYTQYTHSGKKAPRRRRLKFFDGTSLKWYKGGDFVRKLTKS
jgi:DNA helicase-2/ATP-dependent DNA helicase PcrA